VLGQVLAGAGADVRDAEGAEAPDLLVLLLEPVPDDGPHQAASPFPASVRPPCDKAECGYQDDSGHADCRPRPYEVDVMRRV